MDILNFSRERVFYESHASGIYPASSTSSVHQTTRPCASLSVWVVLLRQTLSIEVPFSLNLSSQSSPDIYFV